MIKVISIKGEGFDKFNEPLKNAVESLIKEWYAYENIKIEIVHSFGFNAFIIAYKEG